MCRPVQRVFFRGGGVLIDTIVKLLKNTSHFTKKRECWWATYICLFLWYFAQTGYDVLRIALFFIAKTYPIVLCVLWSSCRILDPLLVAVYNPITISQLLVLLWYHFSSQLSCLFPRKYRLYRKWKLLQMNFDKQNCCRG